MRENMSTLHLTTANFDEEIGNDRALVDFWAAWCGPCKMLGPVIDELAEEYTGRVKVVKIDVDNEKELARRFKIMSIPTVILIENGAEINRFVGVKEKDEYKAAMG